MSTEQTTTEAKKQIGISEIQADLVNGLTRKAIAEKHGMSKAQLDRFFKHPKLASMRTKKPTPFELVDDAPDYIPAPAKKAKKVADTVDSEAAGAAEGDDDTAGDGAFSGFSEGEGI